MIFFNCFQSASDNFLQAPESFYTKFVVLKQIVHAKDCKKIRNGSFAFNYTPNLCDHNCIFNTHLDRDSLCFHAFSDFSDDLGDMQQIKQLFLKFDVSHLFRFFQEQSGNSYLGCLVTNFRKVFKDLIFLQPFDELHKSEKCSGKLLSKAQGKFMNNLIICRYMSLFYVILC